MPLVPSLVFAIFVICQAGLIAVGMHRIRLLLSRRAPSRPCSETITDPGSRSSFTADSGSRSFPPAAAAARALRLLPSVTVQLPLHNERFVVRRLMEAVAAFDYPGDRLEIQVLDDSTDDTTREAEECAAELRGRGLRAWVRHREGRAGFKAGALGEGLAECGGEFLAIFDADFVPPPDFLRRALRGFADPGVGMVQSRWGHINERGSLLTRVQAIFLDGHFLVEHPSRSARGTFFNFNGTAGMWRRAAIEEAGGWQRDTLTEDLDLSYRAQLAGWRFVYLEDLVAPGELPGDINALKGQQYRWAKGSVQTARKLLPRVLRSPLPADVKLEACFHLLGNLSYLFAILPAMAMLPLMWLPDRGRAGILYVLISIFLLTTGAFLAFFIVAIARGGSGSRGRWLCLPALLMVGIGLSLNNARAVLAGMGGKPGEFRRTPKRGVASHGGGCDSARHGGGARLRDGGGAGVRDGGGAAARPYRARLDRWALAEVGLAIYFGFSMLQAARLGHYEALPFLCIFLIGFAYVGGLSLLEGARVAWQERSAGPAI